ncbi:MAG: cryptochrome/photolyase family protein [Rhodanobacteraceae bacterium]|nr:cryptochrome/photolyase family protein [Rhodanobacteraceae bacterium]
MTSALRNLILILGDQLDADSAAFDGFEAARDGVWMAEVREEATHVWSHKARIAVFLAAMRHFAAGLRGRGWDVRYRAHGAHAAATLADALKADLAVWRPERVIMVLAGDGRVDAAIRAVCVEAGVPIEVREDRHFYATPEQFATWANGRRELRLEWFYRDLRKRHRVLMDGAKPATGQWNYDHDNRNGFGAQGPGFLPAPRRFVPDAITREVLDLVARDYAEHPGDLDTFDWPVTAEAAEAALQDFLAHRLPAFGQWQDAMWSGEPWLYHSRLSAAMNLKLLPAKRVVDAVEAEYRAGRVPIAAAEGFIRQILGWREYVRGVYWWRIDQWATDNALDAHASLPEFYWTGDTDLHCLRDAIGQTLRLGHAHHIQRLMVTGLYALLAGVDPQAVHRWYLAVYVDAVEWVELPNTLGMSQFADGGVMASKPYIASGKYIDRQSNYCRGCRYKPDQMLGAEACPITTLYWDFLRRHRDRFKDHPRLGLQVRNLDRFDPDTLAALQAQADSVRSINPPQPA